MDLCDHCGDKTHYHDLYRCRDCFDAVCGACRMFGSEDIDERPTCVCSECYGIWNGFDFDEEINGSDPDVNDVDFN
jgi:hypothetical protein